MLFEKAALADIGKAVIAFANLPAEAVNKESVEKLFGWARLRINDPDAARKAFLHDQRQLVAQLTALVECQTPPRPDQRMRDRRIEDRDGWHEVRDWIDAELEREQHFIHARLTSCERLALEPDSALGVRTSWLVFLAMVSAPELIWRLTRCPFGGCGVFVFGDPNNGRPSVYCSTDHQQRANKAQPGDGPRRGRVRA